jgi:aspartate aminotransferase
MKVGKRRIHDLPDNDITMLGSLAQQLEQEARARGEALPPAARLQIGEPSFRTPEHICAAACRAIEGERMTYGPAAGWPWLRELLAEKIERVNGYAVAPEQTAIAVGGTGAILAALTATVGPGDEVLVSDPHWPQYLMQLACCGATAVNYPLGARNDWLPDVAKMERVPFLLILLSILAGTGQNPSINLSHTIIALYFYRTNSINENQNT